MTLRRRSVRWLQRMAFTGAAAVGAGTLSACASVVGPGGDAAPDQVQTDTVRVDSVPPNDALCTQRMTCNGISTVCTIVPGCEGFDCSSTFCSCFANGCSCTCPGGPLTPPELAA